jgi:hypothetical protein
MVYRYLFYFLTCNKVLHTQSDDGLLTPKHVAFYIFLSIPQYVLKNNCEPEDDLNGRNMLFCK